jgi:transposase-like protein
MTTSPYQVASEKLEIIRLVEQSHLPVRRTLEKLGVSRATFYRWYDLCPTGGLEALEDKPSRPLRVWNRLADKVRDEIVQLALDKPELSPRELAARFTDTKSYFVSEASVYRLLKAHDLVPSPAFIVAKLPFLAGRIPVAGEAKPLRRPDLLIEDEVPFRLSRQHFMIARSGDRLLVSDLGSALGTIVNGQAIGHHFRKDAAPLHRGENHIVAGGWDSPFEFLVSIG